MLRSLFEPQRKIFNSFELIDKLFQYSRPNFICSFSYRTKYGLTLKTEIILVYTI